MSSPIFDSTFGTGRFRREAMGGDMNEQPDAGPKGIDEDAVDAAFEKWAESQPAHPRYAFHAGVEFGLRHAAPPRPDASAGLIEALQQIIDNCDDNSAPQCRHDLALKFVREVALKALRARAADRSGGGCRL